MRDLVLSRVYGEPAICENEILRYAGCKEANDATLALMKDCLKKAKEVLSYRVCFCKLPVTVAAGVCALGDLKFRSKDLAINLNGCDVAILFAATLGAPFDRLIAKHSHLSPSVAHMLDAIGTERIEALCDAFCSDIEAETGAPLKPRFSAGYGDLSIEAQRQIFALLGCEKQIGLTLTDSLIMAPSKSVTAIVGIPTSKA